MESAVTSRPIGRNVALAMYVLIALSYVVNAMDRSVFSNLVKPVNTEFHLSLTQGGFLSTVYAIGFGLTGIFAGYMLDRWARKSIMIIGMVVYSVFTLAIPLSHGFWDMGTYRLITGIGEAMQQTAIFTMAGVFFARNRNLAIGGMNVAYGLGAFLGPVLGVQIFLMTSSDWRSPLYVFGTVGLAFTVLVMFVLRTSFSEYGKTAKGSAPVHFNDAQVPGSWLNRNVILLSISNIVVGCLNYGYIGLYPTFLKSVLHYSPGAAAFAQSLYGIGAFTGLISGYLADRFGERRMIFFAIIGSMVAGLLMFTVVHAAWQQDVLSFLFGAFGSGFLFVNIYALTQKAVKAGHIGKASGIASTAHYLGAGFSGALFGGMVQRWNWSSATVVQMVLMPIISIICIAFIQMDKVQVVNVEKQEVPA